MPFKIKQEVKSRIIGFNGSALPLGKRKDLDVLAEIAVSSNDKSLLDLFETTPTQEVVDKAKEKRFLAKTAKPKAENGEPKNDKISEDE